MTRGERKIERVEGENREVCIHTNTPSTYMIILAIRGRERGLLGEREGNVSERETCGIEEVLLLKFPES